MLSRLLAAGLVWSLAVGSAAAQRLPLTAVPEHYDLAFDVDLAQARFTGTETIRVRIPKQTTRVVLHATRLDLHEVRIVHRAAGPAVEQRATVTLNAGAQTASLDVPRPIPAGQADIHIRFTGELNNDLRGFYLSVANNRRYAVTQFESTDARRAFPCFDEPAYKATFALTLTIDRHDTAISNGRLLSDTPGPGSGRHTLRFATSPKMSSYLVAMAVGNFECLEDEAEGVPIRICATPDKVRLGALAVDWAKRLLTFFNGYFSIKYPFAKLDVVAVPDFAAGAMENTAAIFYRESSLLADSATASRQTQKNIAEVLAHEMAHQWFGDLVTMAWWDDLWLNEGFATWMESVPLAVLRPDWEIDVDDALEARGAMRLDSLKTTRAIHARAETPDEIEALFDTITYEKGASVMRMLEGYLGRDTFRAGVNAYLARFAYGNATSADFWTVMTEASGKPVDRILPTFVNQPGVPLLEASAACRDDQPTITLTQRRFFVDPALAQRRGGPLWQIPVCVRVSDDSPAQCHLLTRRTQTLTTNGRCGDPTIVNAGAHGYFRVAYTPTLLSTLASRSGGKLSAPERLTVVTDGWDLVRSGRRTVADYLTVVRSFDRERVSGVLAEITSRLDFVHDVLADAGTRPGFEAWLRRYLTPLYDEVGAEGRDDDSEDRRALRAVLVRSLGGTARDPRVVAWTQDALKRALDLKAPLDPIVADAVVQVAAQHGDAFLLEALMDAAQRAASPEERYRYLLAAGSFEDPQVVERALRYALSPALRSQDTARYLARFLGNPAARDRAWQFIKEHWPELEPKIAVSFGTIRVIEALGSFCANSARNDIQSFFASRNLGPAALTLEQTTEEITNCIAVKAAQTAALASWLRGQG